MPGSKIPPLRERIRQLIATPSVSCINPAFDQSNRPVIELLAAWLGDLDFKVETLDIPNEPHKCNLIATLGEGPGGLVLAGHTDTVPYDQGCWNFDPFGGQEVDNRIYGLGSADMKAFLAMAVEAAARVDANKLSHPLIILGTADEESSMSGARALVAAQRPDARFAVVGEPTDLKPVRMHKGAFMGSIRVIGRSGHSSNPDLGVNAIEGMHAVLEEILTWREQLQRRFRNPRFTVPVPTLNPGYIHGGDNPNRICASCELQIDLRLLPGMDLEEIKEELNARLTRALAGTELGLEFSSVLEGVPPLETAPESPIVRAAELLTGHAPESAAFATEAPFFNALGMDTIILGPGSINQAHQPDEFLPSESIAPCVDVLEGLIARFCGPRDPALLNYRSDSPN